MQKKKSLIFVCGYLCSGKTTLSKHMYSSLTSCQNTVLIEVGDFVRQLLQKQQREELQGHPELKDQIINMIERQLAVFDIVIISGVRQLEILQVFPEAELIWIDCSYKTLEDRWMMRLEAKDNGVKTVTRFQKLLQGDFDLGTREVRNYILTKNQMNYEQ